MIVVVKPLGIVRYHIRANGTRIVAKQAFLAVFLETEIDNALTFIIIESREFGHITFLVDDLNLLNHLRRNILGGSLHIVSKEFLTIDSHGFDFFAVDGHFSLFIHLHTIHFFEKFFYRRSF